MKILTDILIISIFCNGWYLITRQGMIFAFLKEWYLKFSGGTEGASGEIYWAANHFIILRFIYNPLFGCIICMASIWGSIAYFSLGNTLSFIYPIELVSAACVNLIINNLYDKS